MNLNGFKRIVFAVTSAIAFAAFGEVKVSVLGDSYSSFQSVGSTYYPTGDVTSQSQMWWAQVIAGIDGAVLERNEAWSGAWMSKTDEYSSFICRARKLGAPDVILVCGGMNDDWKGATDASLRSGVELLFKTLDRNYPLARKFFVLNARATTNNKGLKDWSRTALTELCAAHGYPVIDLEGILGDGTDMVSSKDHPNAAGMTKMANAVLAKYADCEQNGYPARADATVVQEADGVYSVNDPTHACARIGDEYVLTFTNISHEITLTFNEPVQLSRALVVGGGGAGGFTIGGGGAGGSVVDAQNLDIELRGDDSATIVVGHGGFEPMTTGGEGDKVLTLWHDLPASGGASSLNVGGSTYQALGGGAGGSWYSNGGAAGGNGGGGAGSAQIAGVIRTGGAALTAGGHRGGNGYPQATVHGDSAPGGGGGAGADGETPSVSGHSGNGGEGIASDITGTSEIYGSGGGGGIGNNVTVRGIGGTNAGSSGATQAAKGTSAVDGFGGGGGGGGYSGGGYGGGNGGNGTVIIRFTVGEVEPQHEPRLAVSGVRDVTCGGATLGWRVSSKGDEFEGSERTDFNAYLTLLAEGDTEPTLVTIAGDDVAARTNLSFPIVGLKPGTAYHCTVYAESTYEAGGVTTDYTSEAKSFDFETPAEIRLIGNVSEELSYLESSGSQYILTGVSPSSTLRIGGRYQHLAQSGLTGNGWVTIFGAFESTSDSLCLWTGNDSHNKLSFNRPAIFETVAAVADTVYDFESDGKSIVVNGVNYTGSANYNCNYRGELPLFAFARQGGFVTCNSRVRLYGFKIWDGQTLLRDFVPVRNAAGEAGLYDLVDGLFYGNDGSGTFVAGDAVENGRMSATMTVQTLAYDGSTVAAMLAGGTAGAKVYACSGAVYGGNALADWTTSAEVGTFDANGEAMVAVPNIGANVNYLRFFTADGHNFTDTTYMPEVEVSPAGAPLVMRPAVVAAGADSATLNVSVASLGGAEACDLFVVYAANGETKTNLVEAGVSDNAVRSVLLTDLAQTSSYTVWTLATADDISALSDGVDFETVTVSLSRLPKEYAEVEYIASSTATEYIDLGVHFKANHTLQLEWANDSLTGLSNEDKGWGTGGGTDNGGNGWNITGGGRRNSGYLRPYIFNANRELKTSANGQFPTSSLMVGDWFADTCAITNTTLYYTMVHLADGERYAISTLTTPSNPFDSGNNIHLFKDDSANYPLPGKKRIRAVKYYDNLTGELLLDLVSVRRVADNKPGLYDLEHGTFFVNQGSGSDFTLGPDTVAYRNSLEFDGDPAALGTLTPDWSEKYIGLSDGEQIICSAPVCDGSVDHAPVGWALYAMDANDEWSLVDDGEGLSYTYIHEAGRRAKLVWRWDVPGVAGSRVTAASTTSFTVAADVTTIGATAAEATVFVAWGRSPDALRFTNELVTVTEAGAASGTVSARMIPSATHYAQVFIVSADGTSLDLAGPVAFSTPSAVPLAVPLEYTLVEYIESHGDEWIDTTVNSSPKINIDLDLQYVVVPGGDNYPFFGERVSQGRHFAIWSNSGAYSGAVINYGNYDPGAGGATGVDMFTTHHVLSNREGSMYVDGELKVTCSSYTWTEGNNYSLYLLAMRTSTSGGVDHRRICGRVFGLKMWERQTDGQPDELLRDFVPVRRNADGAYGLYDLVEGVFHGNISGKGAFTGGKTVYPANSILTVTAEPAEEGVADPAYGFYPNLAAGMTLELFAPKAVSGGYLVCAGASVYTNAADDATVWLPWQELEVTDGSVAYTHPENSNAKLVWHIAAANPLGLGAITLVSAGINSLDLSVEVTGIGVESSSAELTLEYGVTPDALTDSKTVTVNDMGGTVVTLYRLVPGTTYYVKATLANAEGETESAVVPVAVPPFHEEEAGRRIAYYHVQGVAALDSGIYAYGDTRVEADFTIVRSIAQCRPFTAGEYETIRSQDLAFGLYENGGSSFVFCLSAGSTVTTQSGISPTAGGHYLAVLDGVTHDVAISNMATGVSLFSNKMTANPPKDTRSRFPVIFGNRPNDDSLALNTGLPIDIKYHSARIYRAGEQVSNIIAFRRASDGMVGLYDTFTHSFLAEIAGNDQAVFEASPDASPAGRTILRTALGRNGVTVTLGGDETAATLYRVSGSAYGGDDPAAWAECTSLGECAASASETLAALPEDWDDGSILTRFFVVSGTDGAAITNWSETVFWQDVSQPMFSGNLELDGTGGDMLVVKGVMDELGGNSCTLTVYTGTTAEDLSVAWTGLAGSTLTEAGSFELTLYGNDQSAANVIVPGREYFVAVEARAGQKVARSRVASVVTPAGGKMSAGTLQITHRDIVAPYAIETLGADGVNRIELWVGRTSDSLERVAYADVAATGSGTLAHQFAEFGNYYWQLRYLNASAGGTYDWSTSSIAATADVSDMSVYTWKPTVAEGAWANAANWDTDRPGDCLGWPQSSKATARFEEGTEAKVTLDAAVTCGPLDLTESNLVVTITGTSATRLTASVRFGTDSGERKSSTLVLDGAAVTSREQVSVDGGMVIELRNGADFNVSGRDLRLMPKRSTPYGDPLVRIGAGCTVSAGSVGLGSDGLIELAGSLTASGVYFNNSPEKPVVEGGWIRFVGENPQLVLTGWGPYLRSVLDYTGAPRGGLEFVVPQNGYQSVPVVGEHIDFAFNENSQGIVVKVLDESPAFGRAREQIVPLVSVNSVNTNKVAFQALKNARRGSTFLYAENAAEPVWTTPEETTATPKVIAVKVIGIQRTTIIVR